MKKVLVYGLGVSGISTVKALDKMGYDVYTYDKNKIEIDELKGYNYSPISDEKITDYDFLYVVKSPGIKSDDEIVQKLSQKYEIVTDIELSYRLFPEKPFLSVTGTNGKTSTTSMVTHILNQNDIKAISVGNIGEGILWRMYEEASVFVEEVSSFQLKNTYSYHPHIATILNITPDHIDWHGDYDDYINSKFNIAKNQDKNDFIILNKEDEISQSKASSLKAKIYEFSSTSKVDRGLYIKDGFIKFIDEDIEADVLPLADLKIIGNHNYENLMAAILETYLFGLDFNQIAEASKTFRSIEHRLEFVDEVCGVKIYNDSKATNVDSAVKAVESFKDPLIIIAGGYDKKIDYTEYVKSFKNHGKLMILMGDTKYQLEEICKDLNIDYKLVDDMDKAVKLAFEAANSGDVILLSPASASWDMYNSYEERGIDFKNKVNKYKGYLK